MFEKKSLREEMKAKRELLHSPEKDRLIFERAFLAFGEAESFFCYLSFQSEVGTELFTKEGKCFGKPLCVPRVVGKDMLSVAFGVLKKSGLGILQPEEGEEKTCAAAFVPLLAADEEGFRLGYGGGYYDRYFALHPEVYRVGLAYEGQILPRLPREETDIPLDALVTEQRTLFFSGRNFLPAQK